MKSIKLMAILGIFGLVGIILLTSPQFSSKASGDNILEEIAKYRDWTKVSKEPIKVALTIDDGGG